MLLDIAHQVAMSSKESNNFKTVNAMCTWFFSVTVFTHNTRKTCGMLRATIIK